MDGEHVVLPDPQVPPSPAPPMTAMVHPFTSLAYIASATDQILLGTGITLIAQRNAVVLAKETASVDHLSKGRLLFGIGAGYLNQEFEALGINFEERGARTDEYIDAIRELWTSEKPNFQGQFVNFSGIQSRPLAYQAGGPPVLWVEPARRFQTCITKRARLVWFRYGCRNKQQVRRLTQQAARRYR